jgi:hypothetical protein
MYFAILASAAFCFGQTAHVSQDEETVRKFVDDFSAAFSKNDASALDRMTAPDYTFVTPTGTIQNKEQRVAHVTVKSELKGASLNGQSRPSRAYDRLRDWSTL